MPYAVKACLCTDYFFKVDSLAELKGYSSIVRAKVIAVHRVDQTTDSIEFEILEHFAGDTVETVMAYAARTSCALGIKTGEEWLLFAYKARDGEQYYVQSCDRTQQVREADGMRIDWPDLLSDLQRLYGHPQKEYIDGDRKDFYPNGNPELACSYLDGKLHGPYRLWHPNGQLAQSYTYQHGIIADDAMDYYPSGQLKLARHYKNGKRVGLSAAYYDTSASACLLQAHHFRYKISNRHQRQIIPSSISVYDSLGNIMLSKSFLRNGRLREHETYDHQTDIRKTIKYRQRGLKTKASVTYARNGKNYGTHTYYNKWGFVSARIRFDEHGKRITSE